MYEINILYKGKGQYFSLASCFCNPLRLIVLSLILLVSQEILQLNVIHKTEQCAP